jgi:hypothetical protein
MQPARVILAAIFFVIAALIMIPAFRSSSNSSDASQTPSATPTTTATSGSAKPTPTATKSPSATKSASPTPTKSTTPTKAPAPVPTKTATPTATATTTVTPTQAAKPLAVVFGKVACPSRRVTVKVSNDGETTQGYSINRDGSDVITDQLGPHTSRTSELTLKEDKRTTIKVTQDRKAKATRVITANCTKNKATTAPTNDANPSERPQLPKTGSDGAVLLARIATAGASLLTGVIILWWGGLWPRRKEAMFGKRDS